MEDFTLTQEAKCRRLKAALETKGIVPLALPDDSELYRELRGRRDFLVARVADNEGLFPSWLRERGYTHLAGPALFHDQASYEPSGIYPQADAEVSYGLLEEADMVASRLHAATEVETGVLDRALVAGQVPESELWDPLMARSIWNEKLPLVRISGPQGQGGTMVPGWPPLAPYEANQELAERQGRFAALCSFLEQMVKCLEAGRGPQVVLVRKRYRFRHRYNHFQLIDPATWVPLSRLQMEETRRDLTCYVHRKELDVQVCGRALQLGTKHRLRRQTLALRTVSVEAVVPAETKAAFIQATWAYVWQRRREWLQAAPRVDELSFLKRIRRCLKEGQGPALAKTHLGWRFRHPEDPFAGPQEPVQGRYLLEAAQAYLRQARRDASRAPLREADTWVHGPACLLVRRPLWLAEHQLTLVREFFRRWLEREKLPEDTLNIRERPLTTYLQVLQERLQTVQDLERRGLKRVKVLQRNGMLKPDVLRRALAFFDDLAREQDNLQSELEHVVLTKAAVLYGPDFLGYNLAAASLSPEEFEELQAEVAQVC